MAQDLGRADAGGRVHDPVGALEGAAVVEEVLDRLAAHPAVRVRLVLGAVGDRRDHRVDDFHVLAGSQQPVDDIRADEAKSSGNDHLVHSVLRNIASIPLPQPLPDPSVG
jgi:hypothetical protein